MPCTGKRRKLRDYHPGDFICTRCGEYFDGRFKQGFEYHKESCEEKGRKRPFKAGDFRCDKCGEFLSGKHEYNFRTHEDNCQFRGLWKTAGIVPLDAFMNPVDAMMAQHRLNEDLDNPARKEQVKHAKQVDFMKDWVTRSGRVSRKIQKGIEAADVKVEITTSLVSK